ncbi:MAG: glycosyltransferase family protein [Ferruginibacter sp.]
MKILYALQATGNGHICRANEILPVLQRMAEVDVLLSGTQADVGLNYFVKYRRKGLSFVFGKKGGVDYLKTLQELKTKVFLKEVKSIPVENYDFVINDFEPLTAWACKKKNVLCIALSHQYAVIEKLSPKPPKYDPMAWLVLRYYAPCDMGLGFHFKNYTNTIFTPVIRSEIRDAYIRNLGHYTVYLPAYSDKRLLKALTAHPSVQWHIFSKHCKKSFSEKNCWVRPVNNFDFISSSTTCEGILCGAGFETPAEAIFVNKKLLVIPMKGQYEQHCNAAALRELAIPVLKKLSLKKHKKIAEWLNTPVKVHIEYPDNTESIIRTVFSMANNTLKQPNISLENHLIEQTEEVML